MAERHAEINRLNALLAASDLGAALVREREKNVQRDGRLRQEIDDHNRTKAREGYLARELEEIRKELGVVKNAEIIPAIRARGGA